MTFENIKQALRNAIKGVRPHEYFDKKGLHFLVSPELHHEFICGATADYYSVGREALDVHLDYKEVTYLGIKLVRSLDVAEGEWVTRWPDNYRTGESLVRKGLMQEALVREGNGSSPHGRVVHGFVLTNKRREAVITSAADA